MTPDEARTAIEEVLLEIVPDADFGSITGDADLRDALELDSLDFLTFIERLSQRTNCRIEDEDYRSLRSLDEGVAFIQTRAAA